MAAKYLKNNSGQISEVEATVTSAGVGDAGKIVALDNSGKLDTTVMPTGIGAQTQAMVASETLTAGNLVNIWDDAGTRKARKADASNGRRAVGFVLSTFNSGTTATVYLDDSLTGLAGLTIGVPYYLGTNGGVTAIAPSTAGYISQDIGIAVDTTVISFEPQQPITLV